MELDFAVEHEVAIDTIRDKHKVGLSSYALDEKEWELLRQVQDVLKVSCSHHVSTPCLYLLLQVLKDATLYFSRSMPNLAMVIPAMDYIDTTFTTGLLKKEELDLMIHAALGLAKCTINRYYSLTDSSELYCIAMGMYIHFSTVLSPVDLFPTVLHPHYKLEYFKQAGWTLDWVATTQNLICNTFNTLYMSQCLPGDTPEDNSSDEGIVSLFDKSF